MSKQRKASILIENRTGKDILAAQIIHKYSDNYLNTLTWENIPNGSTVKEAKFVDYNTGIATTGKDWWHITWIANDIQMYATSPDNFRGVVDILEKATVSVAEPLAELAVAVAYTSPEPYSKAAAIAAIAIAGTTNVLLNDSSTKGFKQHILKEEDSQNPTRIILQPGNKVEFISPSGKSETVYVDLKARKK